MREQRQQLNADISDLQSLVQYEERLDEEDYHIAHTLSDGSVTTTGESVTDRLVDDGPNSVVWWIYGTTVDRTRIDKTLDSLCELRQEKVSERNDLVSKLDDLKAGKREAE